MGRWQPDTLGRLSRAALTLFEERGFEHTTAAEIARAAGLTESTFFRTFSDKRDVLFAGFAALEQQVAQLLQGAPPQMRPVDALYRTMAWLCAQHEAELPLVRQRQAVIMASAELGERELIRHAALAEVMTAGLVQRGLTQANARSLAHTAMVTFRLSVQAWLADATQNLSQHYITTLAALSRNLSDVTASADIDSLWPC